MSITEAIRAPLAGKAIRALLALAPDTAVLVTGDGEVTVPAASVRSSSSS
jgi:cation transport ATPase